MRTPFLARIRWAIIRLVGGEAMICRVGVTYRAYVSISNTVSIGDGSTRHEAFIKALRYAGYRV